MSKSFRLLEFNVYDDKTNEENKYVDNTEFIVQMFGINEKGETACIFVEDFNPFFFVKVPDEWGEGDKNTFIGHLKQKLGNYYTDSLASAKLIKKKKLYGFDGGKEYSFLLLKFKSTRALNRAKKLWFKDTTIKGVFNRQLIAGGYNWNNAFLEIYESNIPPLLRLFHIKEISPSGWIALPNKYTRRHKSSSTSCKYEYTINYRKIIPLPQKEVQVPYKICSFDIEASSSHGDFPLPVKDYKKLATNIVELWEKLIEPEDQIEPRLKDIILTAFGFGDIDNIDRVYPKKKVDEDIVNVLYDTWIRLCPATIKDDYSVDNFDDNLAETTEGEVDEGKMEENGEEKGWFNKKKIKKNYKNKKGMIIEMLNDEKCDRETKLQELNKTLTKVFPPLQGDKVTFIGSTFLRYGDDAPYLNHCIALNTCSDIEGCQIESYNRERKVLLAWTELIKREDPDIILGYNIFGFDYEFMFKRAQELDCVNSFLQLSRNKREICLTRNWKTGKSGLEESSIVLASGQHDLKFIKMNGRLQIDLYNYFRRDYNLSSYKLDYVSGYFIKDVVTKVEHIDGNTKVYSNNLDGLESRNYINFELVGHSNDLYKDGQKFEVFNITSNSFMIQGIEELDMTTRKIFWGLAKDDVTPQDIFRLTNQGPDERAIIAKYCIQDCNLVQKIFKKIDCMTGLIEMAKLCSVPLIFLIMRGQGIKLTSYISKKCREKGTLMPVIEKNMNNESFEGAMVLPPKCGLYLDRPVACVDYSSLYPSTIVSYNLSHDSKVSTKEYNHDNVLLKENGERDENGNFIYDDLEGYTYIDVKYDTYKYIRKTPKAAATKVKVGYKICRFAQFPNERAILPSILEELLAARKNTKKQIKTEENSFMKNVLDKRQLSIKLTANSLYGGAGAKTSAFCDLDVAASTTAMGRQLLTYAQRIIEETYKDKTVETKFGLMKTDAEYVYGDTDSVFFTFNLRDMEGNKVIGQSALEVTIDLAQEIGKLATKFLPAPHDLEYEKTFFPFILLRKKGYVGLLFELDPNSGTRKSMGIVLKRRDNAGIVKDIYGGMIDILIKDKNIESSINYVRGCLRNMVNESYPIDKLIVTKSLRSGYKNPKQIAHKVLADRMGQRDAGNKPGPGDRIPYAYIVHENKKALQGERIEHPDYIRQNSLKLDYRFYITNQIMKPVQQVYALILEDIQDFKKKKGITLRKWKKELDDLEIKWGSDEIKLKRKVELLRNKEVKTLIFEEFLK